MFRRTLAASLAALLVDQAAADWQWEGRTLDSRQAVDECVKSGTSFSFTDTIEFPSTQVSESDISTASLIDIKYSKNFKVVTNSHAKEQYVLIQCGTEAPTTAEVDAVKAKGDFKRKNFTVPLQKAIASGTTALGFVAALGLEDRMIAVSSYAVAPCWSKAYGNCSAALAGWSNQTLKDMQYAAADGVFDDCTGGCAMENGIGFNPTADPGNLKQAEYVKLMAAFFNKEAEANKIYEATKTKYQAMSSTANTDTTVAWISYNPKSSWSNESFRLSMADYKVQMVTDAGYSNVDAAAMQAALPKLAKSGTTYVLEVMDFTDKKAAADAFLGALSGVGAVIDETYAPLPKDYDINTFYTNYGLTSSSTNGFMQHVLRIDGTMNEDNNLDWFESRIANPDWAVEGLRHSMSGDASMRRKYFRNIAKNEVPEVMSAASCSKEMPTCSSTMPEIILHDGIVLSSSATAPAGVMALALSVLALGLRF